MTASRSSCDSIGISRVPTRSALAIQVHSVYAMGGVGRVSRRGGRRGGSSGGQDPHRRRRTRSRENGEAMSSMTVTTAPADPAARERALLIHPHLPDSIDERVVMTEGSGCRLRDVDGREYLDATGGLWLAQIGHGRAEIAEVAAQQMQRLEYFTSFWEFSN